MCFVSAPPPLPCLIGHSWPTTAVTYIYTMGTQAGSDVSRTLTVPSTNRFAQTHRHSGAKQRNRKPGHSGFLLTKASSKQLSVGPSSSPLRENRHFVSAAALNATDTEACLGLRDHSLLCQQFENKLVKRQIRLSSEMTSRHNKEVAASAA